MADPTPGFQDALYQETVAKLAFQRQRALEEAQRRTGEARAKAGEREGLLTQQEPGTYRTNQFRAASGGVLNSGVNAERRGGIARDYTNRRAAVQKALGETVAQEGRTERNAREQYDREVKTAETAAVGRKRAYDEAHPPAGPQPGPVNPGGVRQNLGPQGFGGVVPYQETSQAGSVRVGTDYGELSRLASSPWSRDPNVRRRQEAAKRALGVG